MKLVRPSFEIWEQPAGLEGVYKQIERAGRVCYKSSPKYRWYSEDKKRWINEDSEEWKAIENPKKEYPIRGENISAKPFVDRMIASGHGAMLEHGTVYLQIKSRDVENYHLFYNKYSSNPHSYINVGRGCMWNTLYITTNYRVLVENNWLDDLEYLCEPTECHKKRITVHFVCDRGVSHEFVRHRVFSFAQESTRYCNYSKDKFGNELTFIIPCWTNLPEQEYGDRVNPKVFNRGNTNGIETSYVDSLRQAEYNYFNLLNQGWKPQQAREVLPNACKTELVMTGFVDDWWGEYLVIDKATGLIDQRIHGKFYDELNNIDRDKYRVVEKGFFPLRCSSGAHPQAQELAIPLREEFVKRRIF